MHALYHSLALPCFHEFDSRIILNTRIAQWQSRRSISGLLWVQALLRFRREAHVDVAQT